MLSHFAKSKLFIRTYNNFIDIFRRHFQLFWYLSDYTEVIFMSLLDDFQWMNLKSNLKNINLRISRWGHWKDDGWRFQYWNWYETPLTTLLNILEKGWGQTKYFSSATHSMENIYLPYLSLNLTLWLFQRKLRNKIFSLDLAISMNSFWNGK